MKVPLTTKDFLDRAALVFGQRIGVVDEPEPPGRSLGELTYQQLEHLARAQAAGLDALGIEPGERVAVVSKNSARLLTAFFGVTAYGRVLVPINFRLRPDEVSYIVEHSGASLLLIDPELDEHLAQVRCARRMCWNVSADEQLYRGDVEPRAWEANEDLLATINYTSGTTARPKGVGLTHRNLWINAAVLGLHLGANDRDVYLHTLPMFHVNGWGMPFTMTGVGAKHIVLRQVDGAEILRRVDRYGVTSMCGAPTVLRMILEAAENCSGPIPGRGQVRVVIAGAPPPTRLIERAESELGWEFIQLYGLTETSPLMTINRRRAENEESDPQQRVHQLGRAGVPTLGVQVHVDEMGEVLARGNVVMDGYWNDPLATADAIRDGWFYTGDAGHLEEDHCLVLTDRKKDIIISGGENVSSIEVQDVIFSHDAVAEVAVIGVPHEKWGETIKALVVLSAGKQATEQELIDFCRARLAHFKCPTSVEFRDRLERTATGKLQKYKLRQPYWEGHTR